MRRIGLVALLVVAGTFIPSADATFPGSNGLIAYDLYTGSGYSIYTEQADGSAQTPLTSGNYDTHPAWSPDGTKIAFAREALQAGGVLAPSRIWVMKADGTGQTQLSNGPGVDVDPAWSPAGTKIVFSSTRADPSPGGCGPCNYELYVMGADGSGVTRLTNDPGVDESPAWSPDGTKIAFVSDRSGTNDIWVMNANGSGTPTDLTNSTADEIDPSWSPDGSKIVYSAKPTGTSTSYDVYSIPATGGTPTRLTNTAAWEQQPSLSPDGTKLLFQTDGALPATPRGSGSSTNVGECNSDGTGCTDLGAGGHPTMQTAACPAISIGPSSPPDGVAGSFYRLYLAAAGGTGPYTFDAVASALPPGMTLTPYGYLAGTPTKIGTYHFVVEAKDAHGCTGQADLVLAVVCSGALAIQGTDALAGKILTVGDPVNIDAHLTVTGAVTSYTVTASFVPGTTLTFATPTQLSVRGSPTQEGIYQIRVSVIDGAGCTAEWRGSVRVEPAVAVWTLRQFAVWAITGKEPTRSGSAVRAGAASVRYDLRYRTRPRGKKLGRYHTVFTNKARLRGRLRAKPKTRYCFSARIHGSKGWGAETCVKTK